ncbi:MAG: transposase zinc-binding domain-containing protein, partial [Candidatus Sedimenticola endophacoides]
MSSPATVQEALGRYLDDTGLDRHRRKVCGHLMACRTEALGEVVYRCPQCEREQRHYHGCRDRHCPQCQGRATRQWVERQGRAVLPVAYHHLVFTLPHRLNGWVQLHPEVLYRLLFQSVWGTIQRFGEDPRRLGGQMGMTAVLHTWGQNLCRHVHLHCLVPAGALTEDGGWKSAKGEYLFPVKALSRHFRGRMVSALRASYQAGELSRIERPGEVDG